MLDVDTLLDHWPALVAYVCRRAPDLDRAACEDVVADALERAVRFADRFTDRGQGPRQWLRVIARNCLVNRQRRDGLRLEVALEPSDAVDDCSVVDLYHATLDAGSDDHLAQIDADAVLARLPERQRALLVRRYREGYGILEADGVGRPAVTASRHHQEALVAYRAAIDTEVAP